MNSSLFVSELLRSRASQLCDGLTSGIGLTRSYSRNRATYCTAACNLLIFSCEWKIKALEKLDERGKANCCGCWQQRSRNRFPCRMKLLRTPSLFGARSIEKLVDGVQRRLRFSPATEITMECNPGAHSPARLGKCNRPVNTHGVGAAVCNSFQRKFRLQFREEDPGYWHFLCTSEGPDSSYSSLVIHMS